MEAKVVSPSYGTRIHLTYGEHFLKDTVRLPIAICPSLAKHKGLTWRKRPSIFSEPIGQGSYILPNSLFEREEQEEENQTEN